MHKYEKNFQPVLFELEKRADMTSFQGKDQRFACFFYRRRVYFKMLIICEAHRQTIYYIRFVRT